MSGMFQPGRGRQNRPRPSLPRRKADYGLERAAGGWKADCANVERDPILQENNSVTVLSVEELDGISERCAIGAHVASGGILKTN